MTTIVLATDGSPSASAACATAIELAQASSWGIEVVTAWRTPISSFAYAPMIVVPEIAEAEEKRAQDVLDHAAEAVTAAGVEVTTTLREGTPADEICKAAEESGAKLIVIGAHGWGPLKRLVFGSVSTGVLHNAPCPVLVVRAEPTPQA